MTLELLFELLMLNRSQPLDVVAESFNIVLTILIYKSYKLSGGVSNLFQIMAKQLLSGFEDQL